MRISLQSLLFPQRWSFLLVTFALVMSVGLVACDSRGTNPGEDDDPEIAKTFTLTVEQTNGSYSYDDQNNVGVAYAIDGTVGKVLTLERGKTYEFVLESSVASGPNGASHPFYVAKTAQGAGNDTFLDSPAMKTSGTVTFSPPSRSPDSLFYECGAHQYMGGKMKITGTTSGSGENDDDGDGNGGGNY